ncbi:hypothetical protein MMC30_007053 [Trapelia coarctata]|nr:hypothetical protein [Trapelia coarctata]
MNPAATKDLLGPLPSSQRERSTTRLQSPVTSFLSKPRCPLGKREHNPLRAVAADGPRRLVLVRSAEKAHLPFVVTSYAADAEGMSQHLASDG